MNETQARKKYLKTAAAISAEFDRVFERAERARDKALAPARKKRDAALNAAIEAYREDCGAGQPWATRPRRQRKGDGDAA